MNNKESIKKYILTLLISLIIGFAIGILVVFFEKTVNISLKDFNYNIILNNLTKIFYMGILVAGLFILILVEKNINDSNKKVKKINNMEEEDLKILEKDLEISTIINSINTSFSLVSIGFIAYNIKNVASSFSFPFIFTFVSMFIFLGYIIISTFQASKIIEIIKKINPEKKGEPLDKNFKEEWFKSCDEMKKLVIYNVIYNTYMKLNTFILGLFTIVMIIGIFVDIGVLPLLIIAIIFCASTLIYMYYSYKFEYGTKKTKINN